MAAISRSRDARRLLAGVLWAVLGGSVVSAAEVRVSPSAVVLNGPEDSQQLLISTNAPGGLSLDLTRRNSL